MCFKSAFTLILAGNLKSQKQLEKINEWTKRMKMKLNGKKTKNIIFNFSQKNQFTTNQPSVDDEKIDLVDETKLLGTHITD